MQNDTIQWLKIDLVMFVSAKNRVKEKACFCAVAEEVKVWKSSTHWTPQTFSSRLRFSLCGRKRRLKISRSPAASCHDPPWSEETLLTQHTRAERRRMNWSNLCNYLPSELRQIQPHNNVWRDKHKTLTLSMDTSHTRRTICRLLSMEFDSRNLKILIITPLVSLDWIKYTNSLLRE